VIHETITESVMNATILRRASIPPLVVLEDNEAWIIWEKNEALGTGQATGDHGYTNLAT
jgi:hypothetical protein